MLNETFTAFATVHGGDIQAHWMEDGNSFWWAEDSTVDRGFYKYDSVAHQRSPLFDVRRLRNALSLIVGHELPNEGVPFNEFMFLPGEEAVSFCFEEKDYILQLSSYVISQVPGESRLDKDRKSVV